MNKKSAYRQMGYSLTMWDVNSFESFLLHALFLLFFNYVGCKWNTMNVFQVKLIGYSLTMWDVNPMIFTDKSKTISCYSLTMWDVNFPFGKLKHKLTMCYSLTMWDVNLCTALPFVNADLVIL